MNCLDKRMRLKMSWHTVLIALGSNLDDPKRKVQEACDRLSSINEIKEFKQSRFYQTSPVSEIPQDDFINACAKFQTSLDPIDLFNKIEEIEGSLGKQPKPKTAPRPIDIDILFYGNQVFSNEKLQIPHPRWRERLFVLIPLKDLVSSVEFSSQKVLLLPLIQKLQTISKEDKVICATSQ